MTSFPGRTKERSPSHIEVTGLQDEITPGTIGIGDKCADHTPKGSSESVLMYNEMMPQQGAHLSRDS
jgi:hypothetical protein